jgi:hypothetical protein
MCDVFALRYTKDSWQTRIDAVEAFPDYITPVHRYIYDNIYLESIEDFIKKHQQCYDIIFAGDVLEHIDKPVALEIIKVFLERYNQALIVGIPLTNRWPQDDILGNPYERHRSTWYKKDFINLGASKIKTYKVGTRWYALVVWRKTTRWKDFNQWLTKRWESFKKKKLGFLFFKFDH